MGILDILMGGAVSSAGNLFSQMQSQDFNADQAQMNRDFQERMSSTSHQREVKDLLAAGLNPILSVNHGASTPGGSSASSTPMDIGSKAVSSAVEMSRAKEDQKTAEAQRSLVEDQSAKVREETHNIAEDTNVKRKQQEIQDQEILTHVQGREHSAASIQKMHSELDMLNEELKSARVRGNVAEVKRLEQEKEGIYRFLTKVQIGLEKVGSTLGALPGGAIRQIIHGDR